MTITRILSNEHVSNSSKKAYEEPFCWSQRVERDSTTLQVLKNQAQATQLLNVINQMFSQLSEY